jgi:hypothetical protein
MMLASCDLNASRRIDSDWQMLARLSPADNAS